MGLFVAGWLQIPFLMKEKRMQHKKSKVSFLGTFFVGTGFAAGWTPCIGPIFGSILFLAVSEPANGIIYIFFFVIGFAFLFFFLIFFFFFYIFSDVIVFSIPFLLLTFFLGSSKWIVRKSQAIMKVGGSIMIVMGVVLFTGQLTRLSLYLLDLVEGTWLSNLG